MTETPINEWICEDELPDGYPYDQMFPLSKLGHDGLGGVRIFPKVPFAAETPKRIQRKKWVILSQHWLGYKPRKFGSYPTEEEAVEACERLNCSPSARWFHYSIKEPMEIANG